MSIMSGVLSVVVMSFVVAACGGGVEMQVDDTWQLADSAGRSSVPARASKWMGTQFCTGAALGEPIKSSEEAALDAYEKTRTKVQLLGISVGPTRDYSCSDVELAGLVTMSDKSGAFFEGGEAVECVSATGRSLIVELGGGHDTDLRFIEPKEPPTLSFDIAVQEKTSLASGARSDARFNCSFDMELR